MHFQVKTTLGRAEIAAYEAITSKTVQRVRRTLCHWGLIVVGLLCLTMTSVGLAMAGGGAGGVIGIVLGAIAVVWGLNWNRYLVWRTARRVPEGFGQTFFFGGDQVVVAVGQSRQVTHSYRDFRAVAESEDYYALFLTKFAGYLLPKAGFTKGEAAAFGPFLREKTGKDLPFVKLGSTSKEKE